MLFRNRRLVRAVSCLLLLEMVGSLVTPAISWAAMGPGQPEFTSYESPGSTDMVNLTTGDMTYNIPVLDVPGPERSFSLPLTYRAGIRLEQEASWVGLGWSLNAGAIARSLNNYPDDISEETYTSYYKKEVGKSWTGGIPGLLDLAWDSETGHSGTADLIGLASLGWENGKVNSGDLVGVKYTKGQGVSVDPVRMAFAAVSIASIGSSSAVSGATNAASKAMAIGGEVGLQVGTSAAIGTALSTLGRSGGSGGGSNQAIVRAKKKFLHTNYWIFFDDNKQETMYGSLYFHEMSKNASPAWKNAPGYHRGPIIYDGEVTNPYASPATFKQALVYNYFRDYGVDQHLEREVGADLHQHAEAVEPDYRVVSLRPLSIAHDDFSVMGNGVSGSIRPQLLEVGSVAFPKKISQEHDKYNVVPFLDDYKISFRFENSASNGYDYHKYAAPTGENQTGIESSLNTYSENPQYEVPSLVLRDTRLKSLFTAKPGSGKPLRLLPRLRQHARESSIAITRRLEFGNAGWYKANTWSGIPIKTSRICIPLRMATGKNSWNSTSRGRERCAN
ncbi:hypothetical protein [Hymenobacter cellulosilyticus]|uniref:Uncharacterized protein n=1 Tax=Hymenobacter cellulosilyticus TaxID=2932248 RepID=A0A8T9QGB9_9BACT|nr:hypothetical protein [Hymenobacter cellulosilyticus]UOQ75198.1 hypothetical protein MUN79_28835 [Hymenobacter cellulosilyticus]